MSNKQLQELFIALRRQLERAVSRIVPPREIEDIVQETYVRICQIDSAQAIRQPRSFLYRIACNLALDHVKRSESRLTVSLDDSSQGECDESELHDAAYEQLAAKQEFELFCAAVQQLPLQCRRVFVLRKVYGYSQKEIAQELNVSENTVEKHIAYGIKRCSYFMSAATAVDSTERHEGRAARLARKRGKS
jgi:RNA polymerase sigma-70 factor (ECF subfamily)